MKYRKPILSVVDRHILMELDIDKYDEKDFKRLLRKAYLNHKAPHEYPDVKRYIRDMVIGKHNSVYIMNNGSPNPLAAASVLGSPYLSSLGSGVALYYDYFYVAQGYSCFNVALGETNNQTNCNSNNVGYVTWSPYVYGYNNGTAISWGIYYLPTTFTSSASGVSGSLPSNSSNYLLVGTKGVNDIPFISPKYAYAPYISSTSPLTLSTYYYWENSTGKTLTEQYAYFSIILDGCATYNCGCPGLVSIMPLFYTQGSFTLNNGTYYLSMWQWTYQ